MAITRHFTVIVEADGPHGNEKTVTIIDYSPEDEQTVVTVWGNNQDKGQIMTHLQDVVNTVTEATEW